jgi:hypothetical protein
MRWQPAGWANSELAGNMKTRGGRRQERLQNLVHRCLTAAAGGSIPSLETMDVSGSPEAVPDQLRF